MKITGKLKSAKVYQSNPDFDIIEMQVDLNTVYLAGDSAEVMSWLNKDITIHVRKDILNGLPALFVTEIATNERTEDTSSIVADNIIPLLQEDSTLFNSDAIKVGQSTLAATSILLDYKADASDKASWYDCKLLDKHSKIINAKCFVTASNMLEIEECLKGCKGNYVTVSLTRSKWGFNITAISFHGAYSNTVTAARANKLIQNLTEHNPLAKMYLEQSNILEILTPYVKEMPGGYNADIAIKLHLLNTYRILCNLTDAEYDTLQIYFLSQYAYISSQLDIAPIVRNTSSIRKVPELKSNQLLNILVSDYREHTEFAKYFMIVDAITGATKNLWKFMCSPETELTEEFKESLK